MVSNLFCNIDEESASQKSSDPEVMALVHWLKSVPVDQDTIDKVNSMKPSLVFLPLFLFRGWFDNTHPHPPTVNPHVCDPVFQLLTHEFTLDCLLHLASRDDLTYCGIR